MEKVYVEKFVTFSQYSTRWEILVWNSPPPSEKHWKIRIPVPEELLSPVIELTEVEPVSEQPAEGPR